MDKKLLEITDDCAKQFSDINNNDKSVSYLVIAVQQELKNGEIEVQTRCRMGGTAGGVAAGIMSILEKHPQGANIIGALDMFTDTNKVDIEFEDENEE